MPAAPLPGLVTILANADCPHCAKASDTLAQWCAEAGVPVAGLDLTRHPEAALRRDVEHSPAVLYEVAGRQRIFPGFPTHAEFDRLLHPLPT